MAIAVAQLVVQHTRNAEVVPSAPAGDKSTYIFLFFVIFYIPISTTLNFPNAFLVFIVCWLYAVVINKI